VAGPLFNRLKAECGATWDAYIDHPFVRALGAGTLPEAAFRTYLIQDYLFLIHFARAYALAAFKAEVLNAFVKEHGVASVCELGCGDGNQLGLAEYPAYLGLDVSRTAIALCRERFAGDSAKSFMWYDGRYFVNPERFLSFDLTLSLDVLYHLVEEDVFAKYLDDLFRLSRRWVIVYSTDKDDVGRAAHGLHRRFTPVVAARFPEFRLVEEIPNRHPKQSGCRFFIFERRR